MSKPGHIEQDVAGDRRMVKLLAGALGATSVVICGVVFFIGQCLADHPVSSTHKHSHLRPPAAPLPQVASPVPLQRPMQIDRTFGDMEARKPVDLAAPWLRSANGQTIWRND